jgi:chromosome segregation protein
MQGFKSFADKTKIEFDSEVTAIVGPNGCGKSNVADAIRWVLGEQSAKTLRGKHMQDVIFNGTENRRSTSYCEVSLFFDNKNRTFNIDFDELVLGRRLDRSGDSEYLINRNACRLKDVVDLLRDTGVGREGYSIIGQGRIDEILSAKPDDRRNIFEEAAGIAKSKSKKVEAERKLLRTRENLSRHEDIMGELFRQLEPLKKQSENARKCREFKDELKLNEVNAYIYQYENNAREKDAINAALLLTETGIKAETEAHDAIVAAFNKRLAGIGDADAEIARLREELTAYLVEAEKNAGELKLANERLNNLRSEESRVSGDIDALKAALEQKREKIEAIRSKTAETAAEAEREKSAVERDDGKLSELKESLGEGELDIENSNKSIIENMARLSDIKSNMSQLLKEEELLRGNREVMSKRIAELEASVLSLSEIKRNFDGETARVKSAIDADADELTRLNAEYSGKRKVIDKAQDESRSLSGRITALETKLKMLEDIKSQYEGFSYPVKKLMTDGKTNADIKKRNRGVVAELIEVEEKYEQAIDVALGAALQNVVVDDEEDAKYLIDYLKEKRYGRVTFLPLSSVKPRFLEREYDEIAKIPGCFGVASELIGYDKKFSGIIRSLLGRTVIVDRIDTAIMMAKRYDYAFRIVTLDGDVFTPGGAITGGSRRSDNNADIISRDRNIAAAKESLDKSREGYAVLERAIQKALTDVEGLKNAIAQKEELLKRNEIAYAALFERLEKVSAQLASVDGERQSLDRQSKAVSLRMDEIRADIDGVDKLESDITARRESIDRLREESRAGLEQKRAERESLEAAVTTAKITLSRLIKDAESLESAAAALTAEIAEGQTRLPVLQSALSKIKAAADEQESLTIAEAMSEGERQKIAGLKERLSKLDEYKAENQKRLAELEEERNKKSAEIAALNEKKIREESALERLDSDVNTLEERVREEYSLDYASALPLRADEYDHQKSLTAINRLKRKINELGDVNMLAVEEYDEVSGRYGDMTAQRDDMLSAEADLLKIISELTGEMHERFKTEFDKINANFQEIFKQLFNGGKAKLSLEAAGDSKDILDAGIEIYAEPPGKRLQHISLLSGGEKALTAIAILFAILKLKPMPFCVLDEIEAALDDSNANLFAEYLKKFSKNTQFIVITHRKPTMELADTLYGVTMEEKGVSKLVSVQLSEAVKHVEKASA